MSVRHFTNPFKEYVENDPVFIDETMIRNLIKRYVREIIKETSLGEVEGGTEGGTLYVGMAGLLQFPINETSFK